MQLLISDANVIIDLEEGGLLETLFSLPYEFMTPDILFYDELEDQHPLLIEMGLKLGELTSEGVAAVELAVAVYSEPSRHDCAAMVLAKTEGCPLLTGDAKLREACEHEGVCVYGSIWIVEQMLILGLVETQLAREAFQKMRDGGRRLPWERVDLMLARFE